LNVQQLHHHLRLANRLNWGEGLAWSFRVMIPCDIDDKMTVATLYRLPDRYVSQTAPLARS
jgi:hypothetical protein